MTVNPFISALGCFQREISKKAHQTPSMPPPPPRDPSQCSSYSISPLGLHGLHKPLCNVFFLCQVNEDSFLSIHDLPEDTSGEYYVHKNFIRSQSAYSSREIVLASHCTGDHLHHLVSLTEVWQGPLSIGLYNFS